MLQDILANFISEAVGILITVFIIDRLIKAQEERRWLPLRYFVYAKLIELTGKLLLCILPPNLRETTNVVYEYGLVSCFPQVEIPPEWDDVGIAEVLSEIDQSIRLQGTFDVDLLSTSKLQIDDILGKAAFLMEPEFLALLLELDRTLTTSMRIKPDLKDERSRWDFVLRLTQIALAAIEVKAWLDQKVSRKVITEITTEQILKETNKLSTKLRKSVRRKTLSKRI